MMFGDVAVDAARKGSNHMAAMQQEQDWQAEAVDLKRNGLESKEIGEVLGKHPATVRKVIAAARERGDLPGPGLGEIATAHNEAVVNGEEAERIAREEVYGHAPETGLVIPGQVDIDGNVAGEDVPPEDDPEFEASDPLDAFRREAGEAVGPMPPSRAVDPQDGMFDAQWDDPDLEAALEAREATREAKLSASKAHKLKDDEVKTMLEKYTLAVGEVARVGRFRIKKTRSESKEVSFVTEPNEQLRIVVDRD